MIYIIYIIWGMDSERENENVPNKYYITGGARNREKKY